MRDALADDACRELVTVVRSVAIRPAPLRRDDERRVARDQAELLALDRLEEASAPALDVVESAERGVELGEAERARIHIGRDDVLAVARDEERLNAVPGSDVQRALHLRAGSQQIAEARRRRVGRDVIGRVVGWVRRQPIGRQQKALDRGNSRLRRDVLADLRQPRALECADAGAAERVLCSSPLDRQFEEEETDRGRERAPRQTPFVYRHVLERGCPGVLAKELFDRLLVVRDVPQRVAERLRGGNVERRNHARTLRNSGQGLWRAHATPRTAPLSRIEVARQAVSDVLRGCRVDTNGVHERPGRGSTSSCPSVRSRP
jgi:hypothetical protein